ncbi:MAG: 16S rRNA (guanine(527)-N(7))-methyltransferase RsmG [Pseudomonadota bacterium]
MTPDEFMALTNVSRETRSRLEAYLELIQRWQRAINLVGPATLNDPWRRHFLDSAQLIRHMPPDPVMIYDLGSGAGLPGLVLAIMGRSGINLVESDQRKAQFQREVVRSLDLQVTIHVQRIETLSSECADVITARALAPVSRLLDLAKPLLRPNAICLFLKGRNVSDELTEARKCWRMSVDSYPSLSEPSGTMLKLWDIGRAPLYRQ